MKKTALCICAVFLFVLPVYGEDYGGGSGTQPDPYIISDPNHMQAIGANSGDWSSHFKLTADIDMSRFTGTEYNIIDDFSGTFDGNGKSISNFSYTSESGIEVGLFGEIQDDALVMNLTLINPNIDWVTIVPSFAGALAGSLISGEIRNCHVEGGSVSGEDIVGGLVGINYGFIVNCSSTSDVGGNLSVGGLVGYNIDLVPNQAVISNCYATGSVSGNNYIGGLVGIFESGVMMDCYSTGLITGPGSYQGGLVGYDYGGGSITASFWDTQTSGTIISSGGFGMTTAQMQSKSTFAYSGWDFDCPDVVWAIDEGSSYPYFFSESSEVLAYAGADQSFSSIPALVTLDGSSGCGGTPSSYEWVQISGPAVILSDPCAVDPNFVPVDFGVYAFELTVDAGSADTVHIIIDDGGVPVADAGLIGYTDGTKRTLDGTGSYDPDDSGPLSYQWTQVSGPTVLIKYGDTATPEIRGLVQNTAMQICSFELVVNDGTYDSLPSSVDVIIVPSGPVENQLFLQSPYFEPGRPTVVWFAGGNCVTGGGNFHYESHPLKDILDQTWEAKANVIWLYYAPDGYPDYAEPRRYYRCADMLIAYLNGVAPNYDQLIETIGFSTGGQPAIDAGVYLNSVYQDRRYAINRVTFTDGACRYYHDDIQAYLDSMAYVNEPGWVANHASSMASFYPDTLGLDFDTTDHGLAWHLYHVSILNGELNNFNRGITAGLYWSVIGPGKNLQLARTGVETYKFKWFGDEDSGYTDFFDGTYTAKLPEPVTLIEPDDQASILAEGILLSCEPSMNAVGYELLVGPDVWNVTHVVSDTPERPIALVTELPADAKYWTIKARDQYGSTIHADPIALPELNRSSDEPYMAAGAKSIAFYARQSGADPEDQILQIHNIGTGSLSWSLTEDCTWLDVFPVSGTTTDVNDVTLEVDISGLDAGSYEYELTVTDAEAVNSPRNVEVKLYILPASALVVPDNHLTIQAAINAASTGDTIIVKPGTYRETIDLGGKDLILRSVDPDDWDIVEWTVIYGHSDGSTVTFNGSETADCHLEGFTITGGWTDIYGGGISGYHTQAAISNCIITNNSADGPGGGIHNADGVIESCIIYGNTSTLNGGGVSKSNALIRNCQVYDNISSTGSGGGFNNCDGDIVNCTIVNNSATGATSTNGGIRYCDGTIKNCIVWGNTAAGIPDQIGASSTPSYSCIYDWAEGGSGNIASNPGFIDASNGDYRLKNYSPCINAGDPNGDYSGQTDIDGDLRVLYGLVDIGSDEVFPVAGDMDSDEDVGTGDISILAEHWLDASSLEQGIEKESWWKLDGDAGDSSGNWYDGTLYGNPVWDPNGWVDGALEFDGDGDYVKITGWRGIAGASSRTVCAWVKTETAGDIVSWGEETAGKRWLFYINSVGGLRIDVYGGHIKTTDFNLCDGAWHHVAAVLPTGYTNVSDVELYVDGIKVTNTSFSSQTIDTGSIAEIRIGVLNEANYRWFNGQIDDMRIYDRALEPDNILQIYEGSEATICLAVGDMNGDCRVDYLDFAIFALQWLWAG